ncbi:hypothetical protein VP1G_10575 [Cytospora mali]|uniref:Uncharacterized protein n=1 Tax=Cytospora mali TaxID=578113 RepID=A0A194UQ78_CYTMA|nr:hypothetical protein VP1G_10575 [Valsa mali var. pyri (nom. inval.)]
MAPPPTNQQSDELSDNRMHSMESSSYKVKYSNATDVLGGCAQMGYGDTFWRRLFGSLGVELNRKVETSASQRGGAGSLHRPGTKSDPKLNPALTPRRRVHSKHMLNVRWQMAC